MANRDKMTFSFLDVPLLMTAIVIITGCNSEPKRVEADYGNSVHQLVQAATYDPEAAASTESIPVIGMDGKRAIRTLDAMQTDVKRPDNFDNIIDIELGD